VDQLNVEKKGIPTVTIATDAFEELARSTMQEQGISDMALVVMAHPIAGHNQEGIQKKVDESLTDILNAATQWQP
jgi:hypothetical protein